MLAAVIAQPAPKLGGGSLEAVIARCLEKDPARRYQTARAVLDALRRPVTPARSWRIVAAAMTLFAVAAAGTIAYRSRKPPIAVNGQIFQSLAVLPVENLSGDPAQEWFADGMTETLITELSRIGSLKVISRTSIMRFKKSQRPLKDIAHDLGVEAVVEGSALRVGNRVRITAQLIEAASDRHVWANDYDRDLADALAVHRQVAQAIAHEIRATVAPGPGAPHATSRNPQAQDEFLLGRHQFWRNNAVGLSSAVAHYERAIQLDPTYAAAWAGLSQALREGGIWGGFDRRDANARARSAALRAVELDPNSALAHTELAHGYGQDDWNWPAAEREFKRAIELEPNSLDAHHLYAITLMALGRSNEAIAECERAMSLDPLGSVVHSGCGRVMYRARRYDDAKRLYDRAIELDPNNYGARARLGDVYEAQGDYPRALQTFEASAKMSSRGDEDLRRARVLARMGRRSEALALLRKHQTSRMGQGAVSRAMAWFALGDRDRGFEALTLAFDRRDLVIYIAHDPLFDDVRSDPRWKALVARLNIPN